MQLSVENIATDDEKIAKEMVRMEADEILAAKTIRKRN